MSTRFWAQIDFVVIGPKGVWFRGQGGIRRNENGRWFTVDRYGDEHQLLKALLIKFAMP